MNLQDRKRFWQNVSPIRLIASTLGVLVGVAGIEHGILEAFQGNVTPDDVWIDAIGPGQRFWEYATETAITVIPNYFWTGLLAIAFGILVTIWAAWFIDRKYGARVLFLLSLVLWLVGGGYGPIFFTILATIAATRINKPLRWWDTHLTGRVNRFLIKLWPWIVPALVLTFWIGVEIAIFGYPLLWIINAELTYGFQWFFGILALVLMLISIPSAIAYEITGNHKLLQTHAG
ncbi:MAG: hypothetical protein ACFFE8_11810 [Candidatus Heimdallarchaeota archaeon]